MTSLKMISKRTLARATLLTLVLTIGVLLTVSNSVAAGRASLSGPEYTDLPGVAGSPHVAPMWITEWRLEVAESLVSRLARGPVPASETLRQITMKGVDTARFGASRGGLLSSVPACCAGEQVVLVAAFLSESRVVAVQESRPFPHQPGQPVYDAPLFSDGWERNGYLPGDESLLGNQFVRGVELLPGNVLPGTEFSTFQEMWSRPGGSSSSFERSAGVVLRGRDALVLVVVPADPREREAATVQPRFIVSAGDGFSR